MTTPQAQLEDKPALLSRARRLGNSSSVLLTVGAIGLWMLQDGIHNWRNLMLRRDNQSSLSPILYHVYFDGWKRVLKAPTPQVNWYIVTVDSGAVRICSAVSTLNAEVSPQPSLMLLVVDEHATGYSTGSCDTPASKGVRFAISPSSLLGDGAKSVILRGFGVLDTSFRAIYGSNNLNDLQRLPAILSLFHATRVPAATAE